MFFFCRDLIGRTQNSRRKSQSLTDQIRLWVDEADENGEMEEMEKQHTGKERRREDVEEEDSWRRDDPEKWEEGGENVEV